MADGWMGPKTPALSPPPPNICKSLLVSPPPPPLRSESDFSSMRFSTSIVIGSGVREWRMRMLASLLR
ncbi:hypothetical protein ALC62_09915 [Cyphomyrmex costatus]|uniref:Uncharacterized protein n=1 Tax=Cyphomyrmex costatus TaxID=456900 RepID=A0A151IEV0_9HYME|nr:hypothetical protein ALC62_09915 [Cyphomyrmex costatus]